MSARSTRTAAPRRLALSATTVAVLVAAMTAGPVATSLAAVPTTAATGVVAAEEPAEVFAPRVDWAGPVDDVWTFAFVSESTDIVTWQYALDGAGPADLAGTDPRHAVLALPDLVPGSYQLAVWATDDAGLVTEIVWPFEVETPLPDTEAPLVDTTRTFEDGAWVFRYQTNEPVDRWAYRVDGGPETEHPGIDERHAEVRLLGLEPGPHDITMSMRDQAGNTAVYRWVFDVAGSVVEPEPTPSTPVTPRPQPVPAPVPAPAAPVTPAAPALSTDAIPASRVARGLARGATGPSVALIQRLVGVTSDGRFGSRTLAAVRAFQRTHGLAPDGVVGPLTWAALVDVANGGPGLASVSAGAVPHALVARGIRQGARGQAVVTIQRLVGTTPDGRFGPRTRLAVQTWQRQHALRADGVVGPLTWAALSTVR